MYLDYFTPVVLRVFVNLDQLGISVIVCHPGLGGRCKIGHLDFCLSAMENAGWRLHLVTR